ncbi:hypothetical protein F7725_000134 [Dissostichus mawsoni]|uniref:Uncharacterized protein n=1 Tax=Dissostichus mawsoni TaxID=36200 RepID=A0A7J5ZFU8_DISMA|nr:hypothetical protein F7725_000134 [Dissostichus mawsoni]
MNKYQRNKSITNDAQQPSVSQFFGNQDGQYSMNHPQQKAITNAILSDLVVDCSLPLSIIENKSFRHFLTVVDRKYSPVCRRTLLKVENLAVERRVVVHSTGVECFEGVGGHHEFIWRSNRFDTRGKIVTISSVAPSVLSLNHHLEKLKPQVCFLSSLVRSLHVSLKKRFGGFSSM